MKVHELESLYQDLSRRLNELESRYKSLEVALYSLPIGILVLSKEGNISLSNSYASALLQVSNIHPGSYWDTFTDDYFGFSTKSFLSTPGKQQRLFLQLGTDKQVEVIAASTETGAVFILYDRTDSVRLEKTLQHNNQLHALGEMAAHLAHEIRNPLGGIEGFACLLKDELKSVEHQEMARCIINGSRALNSLVTSVLNYAKPLDLHFKKQSIETIVKESCLLSANKAYYVSKAPSFDLHADKERLTLAFLNLIHNGWEASNGKAVCITIYPNQLRFEDQGSGIDPTLLENIFLPFFTTKAKGTGLGLPEAYKVIKAHGGCLEVLTTSKQGTIFTVTWDTL